MSNVNRLGKPNWEIYDRMGMILHKHIIPPDEKVQHNLLLYLSTPDSNTEATRRDKHPIGNALRLKYPVGNALRDVPLKRSSRGTPRRAFPTVPSVIDPVP
jgi:hypothetical protein